MTFKEETHRHPGNVTLASLVDFLERYLGSRLVGYLDPGKMHIPLGTFRPK
jgi:hypothetical protein